MAAVAALVLWLVDSMVPREDMRPWLAGLSGLVATLWAVASQCGRPGCGHRGRSRVACGRCLRGTGHEVGSRVTHRFPDQAEPFFGGTVTECVPPKRLS